VFKLGTGKDAARSRKSKAQIARECRKRKQDLQLTTSFANIFPISRPAVQVNGTARPSTSKLHRHLTA
jgi:hypothetical protein